MVSKNNQQLKQQQAAQRAPHYGLRKLSIGVASVLLSTTLYMGVTAHADTAVTSSETAASSTVTVSNPNSSAAEMNSDMTGLGTDSVPAKPDSQAGQPTTRYVRRISANVANVASAQLTVRSFDSSAASSESDKPATAWQPEPTVNYSADHTAKIDVANQPTTVHGDNWQMSLDKNYIKGGQSATLTVKYEAQAGDTFVLDIGYPALDVNVQQFNAQIGTTTTKNSGLRTQVINTFKQAGTYTQVIKLGRYKVSPDSFELLRRVFGDQAFDLTLKQGTSVENVQDVGRLYLISSFTPTMDGTGNVGVDRIDAKYVPVLSTNNNYIFSVRTGWSDSGAILDPSYNGDFVYSISVPKTFELDQAATEAFYQQIRNYEVYYNWGNRGSNVTVSQAGVGAPVVIKANALDWVGWHYLGNEGVSFLGHFVSAPSVATMVTAEGQTTVSDTIGGHTQTVILPGLSAKVINATDYNYANSGDTVFFVSDYGDDNQLYQSHEVPMTGNGNSIRLIHDLSLVNNSPFDVKNATITLTFGDGLHVDVDSVRNDSYISNLLDDNPTHPNREKSFLVTYQDGTSEMVSANSKGDPTKNIKSITLTRDWNASQRAGLHNGGIHGFVASIYQDGSPVKFGDPIKVSLTVTGVDTAGHKVSKTVSDTLKVVDQQFAPLTTENVWGGVDKTTLGANPSGTINMHWNRISGERGKIQLENPTLYFVMPNTVAEVKNPLWGGYGGGESAPGNSTPTLTSITYAKSKDGESTVAIMRFSGTLIDQVPNKNVILYFDTVNKDNVVNQTTKGYVYWTADNVNADGLTKVDPSRLDSQNKSARLPADLSPEQLSKIYFHGMYWGIINMATGIYSTSATKTASTPWRTQTILDYHGDGQADVGVNLVNDTSNVLHNVVAIINLPSATNNSGLTADLTGNTVELLDPNTDHKLTDDATVLYSMQTADLNSNDLSAFVTADQVADWSKVQAVAVTLPTLAGMTSRQVRIPVVVKNLVANAGKTGIIETRVGADELKPIIVSKDAENTAKLVVGGQATIHVQMHYQDAQGKDHYVPLTDLTHVYDILQYHALNSSDFTPSATDLAQIPGYELSKTPPTIISGNAVIGQPVSAAADGSVLQFELVPSTQNVLIKYVDRNGQVVAQQTITGKTGETVAVPNLLPDGWTLYQGQTVPTKLTFGAHNNNRDFAVTHVLAFVPASANLQPGDRIAGTVNKTYPAGVSADNLNKTVTRTIRVTSPSGLIKTVVQIVHFVRNAVVDAVTGQVIYLAWSENGTHLFAGYLPAPVDGYRVDAVKSLAVTPDSQDSTVEVTYTPVAKPITINYQTADGQAVATVTAAKADAAGNVQLVAPAGYVLATTVDQVKVRGDVTDNVYDVMVRPDSHVVTANDRDLPAAVSKSDLKKIVTRTILITMPNGKVRRIEQKVTFVRTANVDSHGALLGYNAWHAVGRAQFNSVFIPKRVGYTLQITDAGSGQLLDKIAKTVLTPDMSNDVIRVNYVKA